MYFNTAVDFLQNIVGRTLRDCCKDSKHFIARYGGDEFTAVCELPENEKIDDFCNLIHERIRQASQGLPYVLSLSMGWAAYDASMKTEQELIRQADAALYKNKQARTENRSYYA